MGSRKSRLWPAGLALLPTLALGIAVAFAPLPAFAKAAPAAAPKAAAKAPAKSADPSQPTGPFTIRPAQGADGVPFCLAEGKYPNDISLMIAFSTTDESNLGFEVKGAQFKKGDTFPLTLAQEPGPYSRSVAAHAVTPDLLLVKLGTDDAFRKTFPKLTALTAKGPEDSMRFTVPDAAKLYLALSTCVNDLQASSDFPDSLADLLKRSGVDFHPLTISGPKSARPYDYGWAVGPIRAGMRESDVDKKQNLDLPTLVSQYLGPIKEDCGEAYKVGDLGPIETGKSITLTTISLTCPAADYNVSYHALLFYLTPTKFSVIWNSAPAGQEKQANDLREKIANTLLGKKP